ncbi:hypothetical protein [Paenibacillus tengchongensis]|nr:hypothetical protein [Paenibacillus tengchongensis]
MEGDPGTQLSVQNEQPHRTIISLPAGAAFHSFATVPSSGL